MLQRISGPWCGNSQSFHEWQFWEEFMSKYDNTVRECDKNLKSIEKYWKKGGVFWWDSAGQIKKLVAWYSKESPKITREGVINAKDWVLLK
jgi:hypothetical protein